MWRDMSNYNLPEEIIVQILLCLPVKSLLRFRCISKSWCSLISSPEFITTHTNHSINNNSNTCLLLRHHPKTHDDENEYLYDQPFFDFSRNPYVTYGKECYTLHRDNSTFDEYMELQEPPIHRTCEFFRIIGSCNGLLCIVNGGNTQHIIIWNPLVRRSVSLPNTYIHCRHHCAYGFGFDPKRNDYKVVKVVCSFDDNSVFAYSTKVELEIYELSTGSWRGINAVPPPYFVCKDSPHANVSGAVHWVALDYPNEPDEIRPLILAFDMVDEVFQVIKLPSNLPRSSHDFALGVCGQWLSLFECHVEIGRSNGAIQTPENHCSLLVSNGAILMEESHCSIWVMKDYGVSESWSKLFTVCLPLGYLSKALSFRKNGEILLVTRKGKLLSYDPEIQQMIDLGIRGTTPYLANLPCSFYVNTYMESLVLLDRANAIWDYKASLEEESHEEWGK